MGRNPATGEAIQIKASKKGRFRAAKDLDGGLRSYGTLRLVNESWRGVVRRLVNPSRATQPASLT